MSDIIHTLLLPYFILYFGIAFVLKSIIVAKRIGKNPLVLPKDDSAYGLIGRYFKITLIVLFIYIVVYTFGMQYHQYFLAIPILENEYIKILGIVLLIISLLWTIIAQVHMKDSWRIGIDLNTKTELIQSGLFSISRNPIFLGMILSLLGLFLSTPNAFTMMFFILGYVLIQIQIRLEEEYLLKEHGEKYLNYSKKVRRLI